MLLPTLRLLKVQLLTFVDEKMLDCVRGTQYMCTMYTEALDGVGGDK